MVEIMVATNQERHVRPSAEKLAELVHRIGARDDRFLVLERIPDLPDVFAQVLHEPGDGYTLEHRDGAADRHFETTVIEPEEAVRVLTAWARQQPGWQNGLAWSLLDLGPVVEAPPLDLGDAERAELEAEVREVLIGGYASRVELAELAEEYLVTKDRRPVSRQQALALADRLWLERVEEQSSWEGETDPERLTRAFALLEAAGITARENFTCCRNCGQTEIGGEAAPGSCGFVYFHNQCTAAAARGQGLTLLYGGFDDSAETTRAVGDEVVAALEATGLHSNWGRDPSRAIRVTPLDWRHRLTR
ncbi:DUF6891 domain-containing protein [Streptacidiphilus sp. PAMC 29251]